MGDEPIKHADPNRYEADVRAALDAFELALTNRYAHEISQRKTVWTVHGPKSLAGEGPQPQPGPSPRPGGTPVDEIVPDSSILAQWARDAREATQARTPRYYQNNLNTLAEGFGALHRTLKQLGESATPGAPSGLGSLVNNINQNEGEAGEFAKWSGISADKFGDFGKCATPALSNQRQIVKTLVNMYALRACIVETARRNTLGAIGRATQLLGATTPTGAENTRWTIIGFGIVVFGIAAAVAPISGGTSLAAGVGTAGVLGSYLDNKYPDQKHVEDIGGIVEGMWGELKKASDELEYDEWELYQKISKHERSIMSTDSQWIELPDLSQISDSGGEAKPGFTVEIEHVENLAKNCFEASEAYEDAIKELVATDVADEQLRGAGFQRTPGDAKVIETRDALHSFLRRTCARYYEAGERLKATASEYYRGEQEKVAALEKLGTEIPDFNGGRLGQGGTVDQNLRATDRSALAPDFPNIPTKKNDKEEGGSIWDRLFPDD